MEENQSATETICELIKLIFEEVWLLDLLKSRGHMELQNYYIWLFNPECPLYYAINPFTQNVIVLKSAGQNPIWGTPVTDDDEILLLVDDILTFIETTKKSNYLKILDFFPSGYIASRSFSEC
jgi:C4-dicarboxylate transporter